eukprot:tig00000984_g6003.t1
MLVSSGAHYGVGPRPRMEDKHTIHKSWIPSSSSSVIKGEWHLFAVMDGHGGSRAAEYAARQLPALLKQKLEEDPTDFRKALKEAFEETDNGFLDMARKFGMSDGTTALVALVGPDRIIVAHVGDCGAVLVSDRSEEEICDLTSDSFGQDFGAENMAGLEDASSSDSGSADACPVLNSTEISVPIPNRALNARGPLSPSESLCSESPSNSASCPNPVSSASSTCSGEDNRSARTSRRTIRGVSLVSAHRADIESEREMIRSRGGLVHEDPDGALRVNGMLQVTRALGDLSFKPQVSNEPEIVECEVPPGMEGTLILASDGVCDVLGPAELAAIVRADCASCESASGDECEHVVAAARDPTGVAKRIIAAAYERGSQDNATTVVVHFARPRPTVCE